MILDLYRLAAFVAVAEHLSFSRAAKVLYVSQPTVSTHVQQLERQLSVQLFNRTTRQVELTAEGTRLLPLARGLLDDARRATELAQAGSPPAIRLDLCVDGDEVGREIVLELQRTGHPPAALELSYSGGVAPMLPRLRAGDLDMGIGSAQNLPEEFEHEVLKLKPIFVAHRGDRFLSTPCVGLSDLVDSTVTVFDLNGTAPEWVDFAIRRYGAVRRPQRASGVITAMSLGPPDEIFLTPGLADYLRVAGCSFAQVVDSPLWPISAIWLAGRRDDDAVVATRAAARRCRTRLKWLSARDPMAA